MGNLIIVESPAKAKTIEKILGADFTVLSSYGHIRDLPKGGNAIDIKNDFEPSYEISPDKVKVVRELRSAAKKADMVWLASDEDREGEAIAWHLSKALDLDPAKTKRIVFHEITPSAIKHAVANPRDIDKNLVDAQQARRVLDRLVGFELSPLLWRKVRPSLSAGRVQSVTVKLIVEREREVLNFATTPYYRVVGEFTTAKGKVFKAELKNRIADRAEAERFMSLLKGANFSVESVSKTPLKRSPAPPFTTSTLQQEASRKLGLSVAQTMSTAQRLYEAGYITYMRTDSVNLSLLAIGASKSEIESQFGVEYSKTRKFTTKSKGAQEAHEAIRPTYFDRHKAGATRDEQRLYELIWKRTVASQMSDALLEKTTITIAIVIGGVKRAEVFVATGEVINFDGFLKLYLEGNDNDSVEGDDDEGLLPQFSDFEQLGYNRIVATQRFTQAPPRYSEASLVKKLEELGIGRPSTYAPTITTVILRGYVEKGSREGKVRDYEVLELSSDSKLSFLTKSEKVGAENKKLFPTSIGMVVTDYLQGEFPEVLNYSFTANVEKEFDEIADGAMKWQTMIGAFYTPFHKNIEKAASNEEYVNTERVVGVDPVSGKQVTARVGRYGPMAQLGDAEEKKFAKLQSGQLIETITIEEAMKLFALPRMVGQFESIDVVIGLGPFGPYVKHNNKFTSLKKDVDDPLTITLERAVELIEEKRQVEANRLIARFEALDAEILRGRFGPYISSGGKNYKIPKTVDAEALDEASCKDIMDTTTPTEPRRGFGKKKPFSKAVVKKSPAKKTAAKKSPAKKVAVKKAVTKKVAVKKVAAKKPTVKKVAAKIPTVKKVEK